MYGDAPSGVGYRRGAGNIIQSLGFTAHNPNRNHPPDRSTRIAVLARHGRLPTALVRTKHGGDLKRRPRRVEVFARRDNWGMANWHGRGREASADIAAPLRGLGLQQYESVFRDEDIDAAVRLSLAAEAPKDLGVSSSLVGGRRRFLMPTSSPRTISIRTTIFAHCGDHFVGARIRAEPGQQACPIGAAPASYWAPSRSSRVTLCACDAVVAQGDGTKQTRRPHLPIKARVNITDVVP